MIGLIPTLLTPAMLAMSPPAMPATHHTYDWQSQRTVMMVSGKKIAPDKLGMMTATSSAIQGGFFIDDYSGS